MSYIVRKAYFNFEKEEQFLNDMAAKGLALKDYKWCKYIFEDAPKGEYIYRLQLLEKSIDHPESQEYIKFMEEMGAELVASYNRWVYFRKKTADGEFTIYSDVPSKIQHYKRIRLLFMIVAALNLFVGLYNFAIGYLSTATGVPPFSTYISIISFSIAALLLILLILPLTKTIVALEKENHIHE